MKKQRITARLKELHQNDGRLGWLPSNPRQWTKDDIRRTKESLERDPDFLEDRPVLLVSCENGFIVFAGNLRCTAAKEAKLKSVPAVVYEPENDEDRETIKRRSILDNGSFGSWDFDALANEWDDLPLTDFGVPAWDPEEWGGGEQERKTDAQRQMENGGLSTEGIEGDEEYQEFVDKFKQKLTTDDCYTPPPVYDAVLAFVGGITDLEGRKVIRPFFPGGNYEDLTQYPDNCVVVDNPPFSILSSIVRFFCEHDIPFFIFAPSLTLFSAHECDVTYLVTNAPVVYENGAVVSTGFITNLVEDIRIWCCPELRQQIIDAQPNEDKAKRGFIYPDYIVTSAVLGRIVAHSTGLKIRKCSCEHIKSCDSAEEQGRSLYGGGYILSERAAATKLNISPREREIIERLNQQEIE